MVEGDLQKMVNEANIGSKLFQGGLEMIQSEGLGTLICGYLAKLPKHVTEESMTLMITDVQDKAPCS